MAVPANMTTLDFSGKYTQNKELSDKMDEILKLQGVSWAMRKAAGLASITLTIKHTREDGVEKLLLKPEGPNTSEELWVLDWKEKENDHKLFGKVAMKTKRVMLEDLEDNFHKDGLKGGAQEHGVVNVYTRGLKASWANDAIWGFEEVNGELRYVRRIVSTGPGGEILRARLVFDCLGDE